MRNTTKRPNALVLYTKKESLPRYRVRSAHLNFRRICTRPLQDTDDALAYACEAERRYNGRLLGEPVGVALADGGENLCLRVESLNSAWTCQKGAEYLEVPFFHIWNSCNPLLHCSFTFRAAGRERSGVAHLALTLSVQQQNQRAETRPAALEINCDLRHASSLAPEPQAAHQTTSCQFRLSQGMICTLSTLLDPPNQQERATRPTCPLQKLRLHFHCRCCGGPSFVDNKVGNSIGIFQKLSTKAR